MSPVVVAVTLFIFALIIGIAIIGRVPTTLHTPLMSGANSIHGVVLIGVIIVGGHINSSSSAIIIFLASLFGAVNVVGGYVVTDRMLDMFKSKKSSETEELKENISEPVSIEIVTKTTQAKGN
ncbi:MAG: NAD(P) transhydrogenase subunit alpha [Candidatus Ancillula trichonymphae]|jgi:NAD(P) transhydrogenase subunit alpha|nr:NAD(P) transhydrogenase subunit alpha [Candidatus Ancillula trichonymphae]